MLFTSPEIIANTLLNTSKANDLIQIKAAFESPEAINEDNPPSKRLKVLFPGYEKVVSGYVIADEIGLERIRAECPHFNTWISKLESLRSEN